MFESAGDSADWTVKHQELHTVLWSSFLDIERDYDADVFRKRYHVIAVTDVALMLLQHIGDSNASPKLSRTFVKLALWSLAPSMVGRDGPEAARFRETFSKTFGFGAAAMSADAFDRAVVPPLPEIGVETAKLRIEGARHLVRGTLESIVMVPFARLKPLVKPSEWVCSPFWTESHVPESNDASLEPGQFRMAVRLPGGWQESSVPKERVVRIDTDIAESPFEARMDYALSETKETTTREGYEVELGDSSGFVSVEKLAGRPNACRVVIRREANFLDFNHHHFRSETVTYWLAADLIAFVGEAHRRPLS